MRITPELVWVLSTAHITAEDAAQLERAKENPQEYGLNWIGYHDHGFILPVVAPNDSRVLPFSEQFKGLLFSAYTHEVSFVVFDADGDRYDDLPQYDW